MPRSSPRTLNLAAICAASTLLAAAVGVSYAYVDLSLNRMGASATVIGLNAAMPALGWLLATPLLPWTVRRLDAKGVTQGLTAVAMVAALGFPLSADLAAWMAFRFLFGGSAGMVFRLVEYWINAASAEHHRARNVGIYAAAFCAGAMAGATVVPMVGLGGWPPAVLMAILTLAAGLVFAGLGAGPPAIDRPPRLDWRHGNGAVVALAGALVYGLFEAVPYTLMPVYAVRGGLTEDWAAWTASAFLLGALLFPVVTGLAADRFGKQRLLAANAAVALMVPLVLPLTLQTPLVLLAGMVVWGGCVGSLYTIALAMLADRFHGAELAGVNAAFGTLYALGNLCGPVLHGLAMDWHDPHGLMASAALLFLLLLVVICRRPWPATGAS